MEIRSSRSTLRPWRRGDEPSLVRYANNRNVWINLRDRFPHPYTAADAEAWIDTAIASEAARAVTEYAFEYFDLCRLEAGVFEWNPASMRVLEKVGYVREGRARLGVTKDGRTGDRLQYALIRG